jgi:hypothetical protein
MPRKKGSPRKPATWPPHPPLITVRGERIRLLGGVTEEQLLRALERFRAAGKRMRGEELTDEELRLLEGLE